MGYITLNCIIICLAMIQGIYLRHKNNLSWVAMPNPEDEGYQKAMVLDFLNGFVLLVGAIPIAVYLFALIQAERLTENQAVEKK